MFHIRAVSGAQGHHPIPDVSKGDIQFYVDCAGFKGFEEGKKVYEEIYLSVGGDQLTYVQEGATFRAVAEVSAVLRDVRGSRVKSECWKIGRRVETFEETRNKIFLFDAIGLMIKPGRYTLEVKVKDVNSAKEGSNRVKLLVPSFEGDGLMLSQIQLAAKIEADTSRHKFVKNGRRVTPNPMRVYGLHWPLLYFYIEVYNLSVGGPGSSTYTTQYAVLDGPGNVVKEYPAKELQKPGASSVIMSGLNVVTLPGGLYTLRVRVVDNDNAQEAVTERSFQVLKPQSPAAQKEEETLAQFSEEDAERNMNLIKYIASKEELKIYKDLNLEGKKQFLDKFWKRRDPTPDTPRNEFKEEHLRRCEEANRFFTDGKKEGWRTDFGRVFILYGKPDEIERHAHEVDLKPYEIWYYYSVEGGVQFVFGDLDGFGSYTLIHSNARNEIYDPEFRRWLR